LEDTLNEFRITNSEARQEIKGKMEKAFKEWFQQRGTAATKRAQLGLVQTLDKHLAPQLVERFWAAFDEKSRLYEVKLQEEAVKLAEKN
jgi:hypothetical protein